MEIELFAVCAPGLEAFTEAELRALGAEALRPEPGGVAFRGDEPTMKSAVDLVGDDNFSWDTDYPHPDGTFPWGIQAMLDQPLSEQSKRKMLWDNAARIFNL